MILTLAAATSLFLLTACNDTTTTSSSSDKTTTSESVDLNSLELPQLSTEVKENEDLVALGDHRRHDQNQIIPRNCTKSCRKLL